MTWLVLAALACGCGSEAERERAEPPATTGLAQPPSRHPPVRPQPAGEDIFRRLRRLSTIHGREDRDLSDVASEMVGVDASVVCWTPSGWPRLVDAINADLPPDERREFDGATDIYAFRIDLAPWVCDALEGLPRTADARDELDLAAALSVFVHETRHLTAAGGNEAAAECAALQKIDDAGGLLGLSESRSRRLAELTWTKLYPLLEDEYRSTECRAGGSLDREPETPEFP